MVVVLLTNPVPWFHLHLPTTSGPWFWTLSTRLPFPTVHISNVLMSGDERAGPGLGDLEKELTCSVSAHDLRVDPVGLSGEHQRVTCPLLGCGPVCLHNYFFFDGIEENMHEEKRAE